MLDLLITGLGVTSAIGQGRTAFTTALMDAQHAFGVMQRPGRQKETAFLGAEIQDLMFPAHISKRLLRTLTLPEQAALVTLDEAWRDAQLDKVDPQRIGLIVGGSNFQQRALIQTYETYADRLEYLRPNFGLSFMDTDVCGVCTEQFNIQGFAYTVGGASASGQLAIIQAMHSVQTGQVDACIALGALFDISYFECQALRSLGAMGSDHYADKPDLACRPFDIHHDGFIYGENCGAIVVERIETASKRSAKSYARILSGAITMDCNRNPNPSYEGEMRVIRMALEQARISPEEIDYVNPHATGTPMGDKTEIQAIIDSHLSHAAINTTKSIIGHGLSSAGTVEVIATLLQMEAQQLHPSRNLETPIQDSCNWIGSTATRYTIKHALTLSMGFGGINTALCLSK